MMSLQAQPLSQQPQPQPQPQRPPQAPPAYVPPASTVHEEPQSDKGVTLGSWVLALFLLMIPVLNIIMLLVWSFKSSTPKAKKNWARANLIWMLIAIAIIAVLYLLGVFNYSTLYSVYRG